MLYRIRARPQKSSLPQFSELLRNGTIREQEPDGAEIVSSMQRATVSGDNVEWYETCYCNPPLFHERKTVYDQFFTDMNIERATKKTELNGDSFWNQLMVTKEKHESAVTEVSPSKIGKYLPLTMRLI